MIGYRNIFVSSDDCYVGETRKGIVKIGFYLDLVNDPSIDGLTVGFDSVVWLQEKSKLSKVLEKVIHSYQRQYGVVVSDIAMIGKAYRNGKEFNYGKLIHSNINPLDYFTVNDDSIVEVGLSDDGEIVINYDNGLADNVSVNVYLHLISISKIKRLTKAGSYSGINWDDFLNIQRNSSAIKIKRESVLI